MLISACATPKVHDYPNLGLKIIRARKNVIQDRCNVAYWDSGEKREPGKGDILACFKPIMREIWIQDNCVGAQALIHELAHAEGIKDPKGAGYEW